MTKGNEFKIVLPLKVNMVKTAQIVTMMTFMKQAVEIVVLMMKKPCVTENMHRN
jgi:hypothetical protein